MNEIKYKGYKIHESNIPVPKYARYNFGLEDAETYSGYAETIEECKKLINETLDTIDPNQINDNLKIER